MLGAIRRLSGKYAYASAKWYANDNILANITAGSTAIGVIGGAYCFSSEKYEDTKYDKKSVLNAIPSGIVGGVVGGFFGFISGAGLFALAPTVPIAFTVATGTVATRTAMDTYKNNKDNNN